MASPNDDCIFPLTRQIFRGTNVPDPDALNRLQPAPSWRPFGAHQVDVAEHRGKTYQASLHERDMVNAALYLRRPLLIEGLPGVGKSSLAHAVAYELALDPVLIWPITSRSTREQGLYGYDAVARFQDIALAAKRLELQRLRPGAGAPDAPAPDDTPVDDLLALPNIGSYLRLGPLGTAFLRSQPLRPSVVLIDELDKSNIDLPNDLLHLFEDAYFEIPEIARLGTSGRDQAADQTHPLGTSVSDHSDPTHQPPEAAEPVWVMPHDGGPAVAVPATGIVRCEAFPLVIMTSNGERDFPPAFLRRCLRLTIQKPEVEKLRRIAKEHLHFEIPERASDAGPARDHQTVTLLEQFTRLRDTENKAVATDQLLNALYLINEGIDLSSGAAERLRNDILAVLTAG